jgi:thiamine biosynthesis lipoprotein
MTADAPRRPVLIEQPDRLGVRSFPAWSCTMRLAVADPEVLGPASDDLIAMLDAVDAVASRFRTDSALSIANRRAGRPMPVPGLLVQLADAALTVARHTGGLVDPTVGRAMRRIGYDRDIADVLAADPGQAATRLTPYRAVSAMPGWRQVRLDRNIGLLTVPAGTELDLGATAKAYTADQAAATLSRRYGTAVLVELGGDIAVAGDRPDGWCVHVAERAGGDGQPVLLHRGGLATSTTALRRWQHGGRTVHHIVDPRTGTSASGPWRTVSVAAHSAIAANAASTAAIVLGADALAWLQARQLAARLVGIDGTVHTTAGWPAHAPLAVAS